jgi:hypothetical protein
MKASFNKSKIRGLTVSAGMTIQYGQFEKRLYRQKEIQRGTWANPICRKSTRNLPTE